VNEGVNSRATKRIAIATSLVVIISSAVVLYQLNAPPHYKLLESHFGSGSHEPTNLFEIMSWQFRSDGPNPHGLSLHEFSDIQHQALLQLLDIQRDLFRHPALPRATGGTYIDHTVAEIRERSDTRIIVIGTGSRKPVYYDRSSVHGPEPYFQLERFTFTSKGELISRESYNQ